MDGAKFSSHGGFSIMADLSLVGKVSSNSQNSVKPLVLKKDVEEKKFDLFCQDGDKKVSYSKNDVTEKNSGGIVRRLFDAVFSYRKAEGASCINYV